MSKKAQTITEFRREVRRAVADYMQSEGCDCCRDHEAHEKHAAALAKLLRVEQYADGSGFNFPRFRTAK
jgi:hypothetical protein